MENSVRSQMISLLNSQLRLRKCIHMGRLQTLNDALIKIILGKKEKLLKYLYGFCVSFLCGNACANTVCERGPQKLLITLYAPAIPFPVEQLFCGQVQRQLAFPVMPLGRLDMSMWSAEGKGGALQPLNICLKADSGSAWKSSLKLCHKVDCEPFHC